MPASTAYRPASQIPPITTGKQWFTEPDAEKPVVYAKEGPASEAEYKAITFPQLFKIAAEKKGDKPALKIERPATQLADLPVVDGKPQVPPPLPHSEWQTWTYSQLFEDTKTIAKAFITLGLKRYDSVNVLGFNSPEWALCQNAAIYAGGKIAGIYPTDTSDQIQYKCDHANGSIIAVDTDTNYAKIQAVVPKLPYVKAVVVWASESTLTPLKNANGDSVPVLSWKELMARGSDSQSSVTDEQLDEIAESQRPGQCCALIYTSGTTGNPKAVMLSHDNVIFAGRCVVLHGMYLYGQRPEQERVISYLPLSHVAGMMVDLVTPTVVTAFMPGWVTCFFARPYDLKAGSLVERLQSIKPTFFMGVPRVWEKMADKVGSTIRAATGIKGALARWALARGADYINATTFDHADPTKKIPLAPTKGFLGGVADKLVLGKIRAKLGLDEAKFCLSGAAPIQADTQQFMAGLGICVHEAYGMSEGVATTSWSYPQHKMWGSVGIPFHAMEVKIVNTDPNNLNIKKDAPFAEDVLNPTEEEQGEVIYRGRSVMLGYMANPRLGEEHVKEIEKKNASAIDDEGFIHTGDKGAMSHYGYVRITGRFKELIIGAGGENIAPVPIEDKIKSLCPFVSNVVMVGDKRKFNIALVTLKQEGATGEFPGTGVLIPGEFKHLRTESKTVEDAIKDPVIIDEIKRCITETNKDGKVVFSNAAKIQKFMILPRDLSISLGDFTATLKLKRSVLEGKFVKVIDSMYETKEVYVPFPMENFAEYFN